MDPDAALGVVADLDVDLVEARWLRAIGECMSVLEVNDEVVQVVSESGRTYLVNPVEGWCDCPDHERREVRCKHLRRVVAEQGIARDDVEAVADGLTELDAAIDAEVARLEDRIDDLRAAQRTFRRLDERLVRITPEEDPVAGTGAGQPGIADD